MNETLTSAGPQLSGYVGCKIVVELNYGFAEPTQIIGYLVAVETSTNTGVVSIRVTEDNHGPVRLIPWHSVGTIFID